MTFLNGETECKEIKNHLQMVYDDSYNLAVSSKKAKQIETFIEECRTADPVVDVLKYYRSLFDNKLISKKQSEELVEERKKLLENKLKELKK